MWNSSNFFKKNPSERDKSNLNNNNNEVNNTPPNLENNNAPNNNLEQIQNQLLQSLPAVIAGMNFVRPINLDPNPENNLVGLEMRVIYQNAIRNINPQNLANSCDLSL